VVIARTWTARASTSGADDYHAYFERVLLPQLRALSGFRGGYLLSRDLPDGLVELTTHTVWESLEAVRGLAGDELTAAAVEPEAKAMLVESDRAVVHRTVLVDAHR
jgi:heme-degrading monooxygenase HmoA